MTDHSYSIYLTVFSPTVFFSVCVWAREFFQQNNIFQQAVDSILIRTMRSLAKFQCVFFLQVWHIKQQNVCLFSKK